MSLEKDKQEAASRVPNCDARLERAEDAAARALRASKGAPADGAVVVHDSPTASSAEVMPRWALVAALQYRGYDTVVSKIAASPHAVPLIIAFSEGVFAYRFLITPAPNAKGGAA